MFVTFDRTVRVNLAVVALGTPDRLYDALAALVVHESGPDFTVSCVLNSVTSSAAPPARPLPGGVLVEQVDGNLGWAGGLHRARGLTDAEYFVWVQEDMTPEPGWLDALVAAADAHPRIGGFGAVRVGEDGEVLLHNAGRAQPTDQVVRWNATDRTAEELPGEVTVFDWVTSKGFLTRTAAFDEVSGPDPRLWPLNHVDKDYCTHLRCHGWDVALVPDARLRHLGGQASPTTFRRFLSEWRDGWFDERWGASVEHLVGLSSARIEHPCAEWRELTADPVEVAVGREASRMLVPFARARAEAEKDQEARWSRAAEVAEERRLRAVAAYQRASVRAKARGRKLTRAKARINELEASPGLAARLWALARRLR